MKKILSTLNQPYPYYNSSNRLPKLIGFVFIFVFLFLYFFKPFLLTKTEHKYSYIIICLLHALNAAMIFGTYFFAINSLCKKLIAEETWRVYKAILITSLLFLFIGIGSFLLRPLIYDNPDNFSARYFIEETFNTFLLGSLVFAAFTLVHFYKLIKRNQAAAGNFEQQLAPQKPEATEELIISIIAENAPFEINTRKFLFANADGNYVTFYFTEGGAVVKHQKRITLKNLEDQLKPFAPFVIKSHRAYLVNTKNIIHMTGNAQGYQLYFKDIDAAIPVSRAMIPAFKTVMDNL